MRKFIDIVESALRVRFDNPGGDYGERKQRQAELIAKEHGGSRSGTVGKLIAGAVTAHLGSEEPYPYMSAKLVNNLPGANDERRRPGDAKFDSLLAKVQEHGWNQEWPCWIRISHTDEAYVCEGNTRAAVAVYLGIRDVKVRFEWMNGAEEVVENWSPQRVLALVSTTPREPTQAARPVTESEGSAAVAAFLIDWDNWYSANDAATVDLKPWGGDTIEIENIHVPSDARQGGIGTRALTALCELADRHRVTLILQSDETNDAVGDDPEDDDDGFADYDEREHWLQTWYSRFDFDYTGDTGDYGPWMRREPR